MSLGHEVSQFASGDSETAAHLVPITRRRCAWDPRIRDWLAPHIAMLLRGCKRWRSLRERIMRRVLLTAASLLALTRMSAAADSDIIASTHDGDLAAIRSLLVADRPEGIKATVTLVSLRLPPSLHDLVLSTFLVDTSPAGRRFCTAGRHSDTCSFTCSRVLYGRRPGGQASAPIARARPGLSLPSPMTSPARMRATTNRRALSSCW